MSLRVPFALLVVAALSVSACKSNDNPTAPSPTQNVPYSQTDLRVGTGPEAALGRTITVNYTLWLYDANASENKGRRIQGSSDFGGPSSFVLAQGSLIQGWVQGIPGMRVGGLRRLVVPPSLGYGAAGNSQGGIPGNATLVFDVELLGVQ